MGLFNSKSSSNSDNDETNRANIWRTIAIIAIIFGVILLLVVGYLLFFGKSDCPVCDTCVISTKDIPVVESAAATLSNYRDTVKSLTSVDTAGSPIEVTTQSGGVCPTGLGSGYEDSEITRPSRQTGTRQQPIVLGKGVEPGVIVLPGNKKSRATKMSQQTSRPDVNKPNILPRPNINRPLPRPNIYDNVTNQTTSPIGLTEPGSIGTNPAGSVDTI